MAASWKRTTTSTRRTCCFSASRRLTWARQAFAGTPGDYGNVTAYSAGYRWYPIMLSRAGLAFDAEYSINKSIGIVPESGDGTGLPPLLPTTACGAAVYSSDLTSTSKGETSDDTNQIRSDIGSGLDGPSDDRCFDRNRSVNACCSTRPVARYA